MGMVPEDFYSCFVLENLSDFKSEPSSVRRAFNAAVACSHFADHYYYYCSRYDKVRVQSYGSLKKFLAQLSVVTSDQFKYIRDIANAYKHLYTDKGDRSSVSSAGAISTVYLGRRSDDVSDVGESWESRSGKVVFTCRGGQRREFLPCIEAVVERLGNLLSTDAPVV